MIELIKDLFRRFAHTWIGLITGFFLVFLTIVVPIDSFVEKGVPSFPVRLATYGAIECCWLVCWQRYRSYLPRTQTGKVGVFIVINTENDKQKKRIRFDFAKGIEKSLRENNLSELIMINVLEDFRAERVLAVLSHYSEARNEDRARHSTSAANQRIFKRFRRLIKITHGHFFIWGSIIERMSEENRYFLALNALVVHKPVDIATSNALIAEFRSIFPSQISVLERLEFQGFEIASNVIYVAVSYMSGIAAFVSGDPFTAFRLHNGLQRELRKLPAIPPMSHVSKSLVPLLATELSQQARYYYFKKHDLDRAKHALDLAEKLDSSIYDIKILRCFIAFASYRDVAHALEYVDSAMKLSAGLSTEDYTWLYNKAFLLMYRGEFAEAVKLYDELESKKFDQENAILDQCIPFDTDVLKQEPRKIQIHYVLGFLYLKKRGDLEQARYHFNTLIEKATDASYRLLCERSRLYLSQMN